MNGDQRVKPYSYKMSNFRHTVVTIASSIKYLKFARRDLFFY
jgi:hypothetical protein